MQFLMDLGKCEDDDEIQFVGFLANVDSSILRLRLERGFTVREISKKDRDDLLGRLEGGPLPEIGHGTDVSQLRWTDNSYIIENTFEGWATTAGENEEGIVLDLNYNDVARVALYLEPSLRRLRFASCKNIFLPLEYFYVKSESTFVTRRRVWTTGIIERQPSLSLSDDDLVEFEKITKTGVVPSRKEFLRLALQHFDLSFETQHKPLAFLVLMTALEIILQPGRQGKAVSLSQRGAKLLAPQDPEKDLIIRELADLYRRRNAIIHEGISYVHTERGREPAVDEAILLKTRQYLRRVLTKADETGKSKEELSLLLAS